MDHFIYLITNLINDKVYIGQTKQDINKRFAHHKSPSHKYCVKLHNAFNAHDRINFKIECIAQCSNQENADYLEQFYIQQYDSVNNGYNIESGGGHSAPSEETKKKISDALKGKPKSKEAMAKTHAFNRGKPRSQETKDKMSKSTKGRVAWNKGLKKQ